MNYSNILDKKNILITGGTGSFGRQIIHELMKYKPSSIRIFSRDEDKQYSLQQELADSIILKKMEFLIGDVRDYDRLYSVMKNVDIVFHAAALKQVPAVEKHPYEAVKTNIFGTYNIVNDETPSLQEVFNSLQQFFPNESKTDEIFNQDSVCIIDGIAKVIVRE